jgi:RimJ/RimL family protein N-acetyltransferase
MSMPGKIETSRLLLRPFEPADAEAAFTWFGDPTVMRFTPTGADTSVGQTEARLANYQRHQVAHGFSKWIVLDRDSETPIGDSGLLVLEEYGWIDLGVRLARAYGGKGLATEAASAWVRAGLNQFRFERLTAFVHPENFAAIRVLAKLGFLVDRRDTIMGMNSILFSLDAKDAQRAKK